MKGEGVSTVVRMTQAEAFGTLGQSLDGHQIEITDGVNKGILMNSGAAGSTPSMPVTEASIQTILAASLVKVQLTGTGAVPITSALHKTAEVHINTGVTSVTMAVAAWSATAPNILTVELYNDTVTAIPVTIAGFNGGISLDGDTTNDIGGTGTLVTIPVNSSVQIYADADRWVRAKKTSEVTQAELNAVSAQSANALPWAATTLVRANEFRTATVAVGGFVVGQLISSSLLRTTGATFNAAEAMLWNDATIGKAYTSVVTANEGTTQRVHEKALTKTPFLAHPLSFTANTLTSGGELYTLLAGSEFSSVYAAWRVVDNNDANSWAVLGTGSTANVNRWIRMQFAVPKICTRAVLRGRGSTVERITQWRIEGSNDGVIWTSLISQTITLGVTTQTFDFINTTAYLYYRLWDIADEGGNVGLSRMEFHESVYAPAMITEYDWAASTIVLANEIKRATVSAGQFALGDTMRSNSTRTTGATFNATEAANWTMISRVLCAVTLNIPANLSIPFGFATTYFSFVSEQADSHNFHDNTTNPTRLTAPATGTYLLTGKCPTNSGTVQSYRTLAYRLNGAGTQYITMIDNPADIGMYLTGVQSIVLNAGDYIEVGLGNISSEAYTTADEGSVTLVRV